MMKKSMMILAALVMVCVSLPVSAAPTLAVTPELYDAVVDSTGKTVSSLSVQGYHCGVGSFGSVQRSYLMFDLSSIPDDATVVSAEFGMYLGGISQGSYNSCDPSTGVYYVQNDSWTKSGITWGNAPAASYGGDYQDTVTPSSTNPYVWDIFSGTDFQWAWAPDLVDNRISLMIDTQFEGANNWAHFYNPYLKVEYTTAVVPEPTVMTLSLIGLASVAVAKRKKKI
jgi:hypothetical protein